MKTGTWRGSQVYWHIQAVMRFSFINNALRINYLAGVRPTQGSLQNMRICYLVRIGCQPGGWAAAASLGQADRVEASVDRRRDALAGHQLGAGKDLSPGLLTGQDGLAKLVEAVLNRIFPGG